MIDGPESAGIGKGTPGQLNPILDKDTALAKIINKKASPLRRAQLNIVESIIEKFDVGSKVKVIITPKTRERSEGIGVIQGFRFDKQRGWEIIYDNNGTQKHVTIDGKGYSASSLELRHTDKGIELLDKLDDYRAIVSIERV